MLYKKFCRFLESLFKEKSPRRLQSWSGGAAARFATNTADATGGTMIKRYALLSGLGAAITPSALTVTPSNEIKKVTRIYDVGKSILTVAAVTLLAVSHATAAPAVSESQLDVNKVFMIHDLSVVEDRVRTVYSPSLTPGSKGVWSFGRLIEKMAGANDPSDFVLRWLQHWEADQQVNGQLVPARPAIRDLVIDPWIIASGGLPLDFAKAPFRLLAIVNRMDLARLATDTNPSASAGEGRFVFGVLDAAGNPTQFTVIMEFELLAQDNADILQWVQRWESLNNKNFGATYNAALEKLTREFIAPGIAPDRPNGSALKQLRTNEIALAGPWELREFTLSPMTGFLEQTTVKQTPGDNLNGSNALARFINRNTKAILAGRHVVPNQLLGGSSFAPQVWNAVGIRNPDARHLFALQTCNGCHTDETGTFFLHVSPRSKGEAAFLSGFLTGTSVSDPITGEVRNFNELELRRKLLTQLKRTLVPNDGVSASSLPDTSANWQNRTRVH